MGQLAGGIAHDFNNVLQAIAGAVGLIRASLADGAKVARMASIAEAAAARGASITRRLLAFARHGDLLAEDLSAAAVLGGVAEILAHTLGSTIHIVVQAAEDLPHMLADRGQLETVLVNLATNARDAMPRGGTLTLAAGCEDGAAGSLAEGAYVCLTVADTGCGIEPAVLARVTEPFFTTKPIGQGTGLGLSIARGFAEQSGGALTIESTPGEGTRVRLFLPRAPAGAVPSPAPPRLVAGPRICVMLADDDDLVRQALGAGLEAVGWHVVQQPDGSAALAALGAGEFVDVLVSDLAMPGLDGVATIAGAQRLRPGLPALLLTGHAERLPPGVAGGGAIYQLLRKPIGAAELAAAIREVVRPATA